MASNSEEDIQPTSSMSLVPLDTARTAAANSLRSARLANSLDLMDNEPGSSSGLQQPSSAAAGLNRASIPQLFLFLLSNSPNAPAAMSQQPTAHLQQQFNTSQSSTQQMPLSSPLPTTNNQAQATTSSADTAAAAAAAAALAAQQLPSDKNLGSSLEYLNRIRDPAGILDDELAILALINTNEIYRKNREQISVILESRLQFILKDMFVYIYEHLSRYVNEKQFNVDLENSQTRFTAFHLIVDLTEILVVSSREFASKFHMTGGTKCLLGYIGNEKMMDYMTKSFTDQDPFKKQRKMNYCKALASLLNILFHLKTGYYQSFKEMNAIEILTKFSNQLKYRNCELILRSHFILAGISNRKQIESLKNIGFTVLILEKTLQMFAQATQKKTKYTSYEFDFFFDNEMRTFEINTNGYPNTFMVQISFITEAFLISDEIKYRIFETIKNSLLILLIQGDQLEKYVALNLLNNFAFDEVLCEKLCQNINFLTSTSQILNTNEKTEELLRSVALCFKTLLNLKQMVSAYNSKQQRTRTSTQASARTLTSVSLSLNTSRSDTAAAAGVFDESNNGKFIFLSSHDSNELISLRIKHELEKRGYNVVMSERKSGKTFDIDKVMQSIENCACMIVCLSSSYQCEQLCQLEAHYAARLQKTIVPCMVQVNYEPDYWTEALMRGIKRCIKIKLPTIDDDMSTLVKEIVSKAKLKPTNSNAVAASYSQKSSATCSLL